MTAKTFAIALSIVVSIALPSKAGLMLSEVCFNEVGSDTTGEWIEIFNTGPTTIDLTNYKIGDEESNVGTGPTEAMHRFPTGASIAPGELQIVTVSATRFFTVYGIKPTYEVNPTDLTVPDMLPYPTWDSDGGAFNMSNSNDQALILDGSDSIVDTASWGTSTFAFNPALGSALDGQSYERKNSYIDTNTAADWKTVGDANVPAESRSTPFTANVPEPTAIVLALGLALGCSMLRRR